MRVPRWYDLYDTDYAMEIVRWQGKDIRADLEGDPEAERRYIDVTMVMMMTGRR